MEEEEGEGGGGRKEGDKKAEFGKARSQAITVVENSKLSPNFFLHA